MPAAWQPPRVAPTLGPLSSLEFRARAPLLQVRRPKPRGWAAESPPCPLLRHMGLSELKEGADTPQNLPAARSGRPPCREATVALRFELQGGLDWASERGWGPLALRWGVARPGLRFGKAVGTADLWAGQCGPPRGGTRPQMGPFQTPAVSLRPTRLPRDRTLSCVPRSSPGPGTQLVRYLRNP